MPDDFLNNFGFYEGQPVITQLTSDPIGLHRVLDDPAVLPQAARRLDNRRELWPDEVRLRVERLNLDAASYRQLTEQHRGTDGAVDTAALRAQVLGIVSERGKLQNPVTGSGGMLVGTVEEIGPASPLGLRPGQRVASLVSLSLTPLAIEDGLAGWDGTGEQVPCDGYAVLFGRSLAAPLPEDLPVPLALAVLDVCGAPALTARVVTEHAAHSDGPAATVVVLGAAGKSGALSLAAARAAGAGRVVGLVRDDREAALLGAAGTVDHPLADAVTVADARDPVRVREAVLDAGGPADVTIVCVDVPGCEGGAILATGDGGTVVFFSMATSFTAAALGAEGVGADVRMLVGNGYVPGHAAYALDLVRAHPGVRSLLERRCPR